MNPIDYIKIIDNKTFIQLPKDENCSGKLVEILSNEEFLPKYISTPSFGRPMDHDHNNWAFFIFNDKNYDFDSLTEVEKWFMAEMRFHIYSVYK